MADPVRSIRWSRESKSRPEVLRRQGPRLPWPSRPDGEALWDLPPGRAFMPFLVTRRCEALSLFEQEIDASPAMEGLKTLDSSGVQAPSFFSLVLCALARALHEQPALNRYVMGRRIYQRREVTLTFSGRSSPRASAPVYLSKLRFEAGAPPVETGRRIAEDVQRQRASTSRDDAPLLRRFLRLPWPAGCLLMRLGQGLDHCNLLPSRWVLAHPLHASAFVANLGSLGAPGAYHPLYEHGAISLAVVVGSLRKNANPRDGAHRSRCNLHYTYDGRIAEAAECVAFAARVKALLEDPKFSLS